MEASNRELLQRSFSRSEGVDVAPLVRALLAGDTSTLPPGLAADLAAWLDLLDPKIEIDPTAMNMPDSGVLRGLGGMRELWSRWIESWESYSWTHTNWDEIGEHVIVDVKLLATGRDSGAEVVANQCHVYVFRDGRVIRWSFFNDRASALAEIETQKHGESRTTTGKPG